MSARRLRLAAALVALAFVAAACGSDDEPSTDAAGNQLTPIDFAFEWTCSGDWALQYIAEAKGYWAEEGVDVRYVRGQGGSGTLPLVASGERDMAEISAPPVVLGAAEDLPVTVVGVAAAESPVVLFADGSIKQPEDLYGKTVAVQSGEFEGGVWEAFVKKVGLDVSKIKTVPATGTSNTLFIDHRVDAFISFYLDPATVSLTEDRRGEETLFFMKEYVPTYGHTIVANNRFLEENPEAVRGFLKGWARATQYATANPQEALGLLTKNCPELGDAPAKFTLDAYIESWNDEAHRQNGYLTFSPDGFAQTQTVLVDAGLTEAKDLSNLTTADYLPDPPIKAES
jgi:NitT/TauT family transport system substrate-binding protein